MEISDIRINPDNHKDYNPEYNSWGYQKTLDIHTDINRFLDSQFPGLNVDFGGNYASFLDNVGIDSNSENGWWSIYAVDPDNIEYFVKTWKDENANDEYVEAKRIYDKMKGKINHKFTKISEFVDFFNAITQ
jgi:hypothetical protein